MDLSDAVPRIFRMDMNARIFRSSGHGHSIADGHSERWERRTGRIKNESRTGEEKHCQSIIGEVACLNRVEI